MIPALPMTSDLLTLAQWMAGDFSNRQQAFDNAKLFAHIHVFFRPLPWDFFEGIGFYSEQVYDYDLWSPYRQGVHRFVDRGDHIYIENYGLIEPMLYAGAAREPSILGTITTAALKPRCGCAMVFRRSGDCFIGSVEPGRQCIIPKQGIDTYLVSEVEVTATTWNSLDRGFDPATEDVVWGSEHGPLQFTKAQSFADEVPLRQPYWPGLSLGLN
jgi:CpeT protein